MRISRDVPRVDTSTMPTARVLLELCPRCNLSHPDLEVRRLKQPSLEWCAWAMCPINMEPILFQLTLEEKVILETVEQERERQLRRVGLLPKSSPTIPESQ